jgi:hypothetical protein
MQAAYASGILCKKRPATTRAEHGVTGLKSWSFRKWEESLFLPTLLL